MSARAWPLRILLLSAYVVGGLFLLLAVFFTQTTWGRELVLREVLARVERGIRGEVEVESVSSDGLLRGLTLRGVRIAGENGRPFLAADSVRGAPSPIALLRGDLVFSRVAVFRPRLTIERLTDDAEWNVAAIFGGEEPEEPGEQAGAEAEGETPGEEASRGRGGPSEREEAPVDSLEEGSGAGGRTILFRGFRIVDGTLNILFPIGEANRDAERILFVADARGRPSLRRLAFQNLNVEFRTAALASPGRRGQRFDIESLSLRGQVWRDPFIIQDLAGRLTVEGPGLSLGMEELSLPDSRLQGEVELDWSTPSTVRATARGSAERLALADLQWVEPRLPAGVAQGPFGLDLAGGGVVLHFQDTRAELDLGRIRGDGSLALGGGMGFGDLALALEGVDLDIITPWVPDTLPLRGWLDGNLDLDGDLDAFTLDGDLTFTAPDSVANAEIRVTGDLHLGDSLGATGLAVTVAPMDWRALSGVAPGVGLTGPGSLRLEATGILSEGLTVSAEATHVPGDMAPSRVVANGVIEGSPEDLFLDLEGQLRPLSLTALRRDFPGLPLTGEVDGTLHVSGPFWDLSILSRLATSAGPLEVDARLDVTDPARGYTLDARTEGLTLSRLVPSLPDPTRVTGRVLASGRGIRRDSLAGEATAFIREGEVGTIGVDTAAAVLRIEGGLLLVDALAAETDLGAVSAGGSFGLARGSQPGELQLRVASETLTGLQPFLFGEVQIARDTLGDLEREFLALEGTDPDTLPTLAEIRVDGAVQGSAILRGGLEDFTAEGRLDFQRLRYRSDFVSEGRLTFSGQGLPGPNRRVEATLEADSLLVRSFSFKRSEAELDLGTREGSVLARLTRSDSEDYRARGTFALDSLGGGRVNLDQLTLRFDTLRWNLGGPAAFAWSDEGVLVQDFRLIRPGPEGMRVEADGFLPLAGEANLDVAVTRLNLANLARVTQLGRSLEGIVDASFHLTGRHDAPTATGFLQGEDLRFDELYLGRLRSELEYRDLRIQGRIEASEVGQRVLHAAGAFPADLRLMEVEDRIPEAPVDVTIALDSFPAALALAIVPTMEEVAGSLSGQVHIGGTPDDLSPSGEVLLADGSVLLPDLGVRFDGITAGFEVLPDASIAVEGQLRSRGTARVTGSVRLDEPSNPELNLTVETRDFLAARRRDVQARVSGSLEVRERYRTPRVEGGLRVEQGVLFVEEFARSAEVVDLADPAFFRVADTTLTTLQPAIRSSVNPFLQNLMLNVTVDLERDSWLRGRDLNVEMAGRLQVFWDRMNRDLAMVGQLEAVRGIYTVFGRQFQVDEGTVSFLGTPGMNPTLDIRAQNRLRTAEGDDLEIVAQVSGTLLAPRVSLSSTSPFPISESDLVAYLIFGRPTYALATGQSRLAAGAAGSLLGAATGAGVTLGLGSLSSELGAVFTRDVGLDYLAISQGQDADPFGTRGLSGTLSETVATTQVEVGQYLTDELFAALTWRPLATVGGANLDPFARLRLEWRLSDLWTLESFWEDRFARAPLFRVADLAFYQQSKVLGFFLFRQWGY